MLATLKLLMIICLLLPLSSYGQEQERSKTPDTGQYTPKPSQDFTWAQGDWTAKGEHPVQGRIVQWRVKISSDGQFSAELTRTTGIVSSYERGIWHAQDREIWSFITYERDRKRLELPSMDLYTILVISTNALELRHIENGKVLRLERGSV